MNVAAIHVGMRVRHPHHALGTVKAVDEQTATVLFDDGVRRQVSPEASGLQPAETQASLSGLEMPLAQLIAETVRAVADRMGLENPDAVREELASRWHGGKLVIHPADPTLATKEVPIDVFFHKIVMMRNNLRTLEQKLNGSDRLTDVEKFDWQGYITRCYGSMTTFNVLFRRKEDQFNSKGGED
ncbi:MAG: hypothetical protein JNL97_04055 [Verrucomicrobiales bacterium]|nr:hypothetical protein [Verrucomicrobiales bacterium]